MILYISNDVVPIIIQNKTWLFIGSRLRQQLREPMNNQVLF